MDVRRVFWPLIVFLIGGVLTAGCQQLALLVPEESLVTTPVADENAASTPITTSLVISPLVDLATVPSVGGPPVRLQIPELEIDVPVVPMTWEIVTVDGERTTRWTPPEDAAGWAVNSAGVGALGNVVIAGHQAQGQAVFEAIALGELEVGRQILLSDETGDTATYEVAVISEPIPLVGASETERALAAAYVAPTADARLTLVTGWPAATTTHRIFVIARLAPNEAE
ncbi:MAG: sortase [Caldilinea sp.]|nr:sortase [Caldilinea sp.]MDW8441086.1 class F sortase [Caldilineaceae bacterium]